MTNNEQLLMKLLSLWTKALILRNNNNSQAIHHALRYSSLNILTLLQFLTAHEILRFGFLRPSFFPQMI